MIEKKIEGTNWKLCMEEKNVSKVLDKYRNA